MCNHHSNSKKWLDKETCVYTLPVMIGILMATGSVELGYASTLTDPK